VKNNNAFGIFRRTAILMADLLLNNRMALGFLGRLNERFGFAVSVFFDYPVSRLYANYYSFPFFRERVMNWQRPILSGLIIFNGKLVVKFSTAKEPSDFVSADSEKGLISFYRKAEEIRDLLKVGEMSFAGILPGVFFRHKLIKNRNFSAITARVVSDAVDKVFRERGLPDDFPVISLGGAGFVGRAVSSEMKGRGRNFFVVDLKENNGQWPETLLGRPAIILNLLSDNSGLSRYLELLVKGSIFINEAYPPPGEDFVAAAARNGVISYHICGAEADLVCPSFPGYYRGEGSKSIPCCAVPFSLIKQGAKPVLRQL
jgi:hypothetical protein